MAGNKTKKQGGHGYQHCTKLVALAYACTKPGKSQSLGKMRPFTAMAAYARIHGYAPARGTHGQQGELTLFSTWSTREAMSVN